MNRLERIRTLGEFKQFFQKYPPIREHALERNSDGVNLIMLPQMFLEIHYLSGKSDSLIINSTGYTTIELLSRYTDNGLLKEEFKSTLDKYEILR